ncbi:MAG: sugar transferase, partial [Paracoccaceae bacterium]
TILCIEHQRFGLFHVPSDGGGGTGGEGSLPLFRQKLRHARFLRKTRLDELPQLINIIKGDMSFVGPRPPLRQYTEDCPEVYWQVLACRPGVTGLATLVFHAHEERLLAACSSATETDRTYRRRCIPRKARLDMIYADNRNPCFDLWLLWRTLTRAFTAPKPPLP